MQSSGEKGINFLLSLSVPNVIQLQDIYEEIEQCDEIQSLKRQLIAGEPVKKGFAVVDGRVWYKKQLYIPQTSKFIFVLLHEFHDGLSGGHSGVL